MAISLKYTGILLIAAIVLLLASTASGQVYSSKDLKVSELAEKVWVIETTDMTTMYLIEGSEKALLIDTGTRCDSLDKVISKITSRPVDVVLTHAHGDHDGNIGYFSAVWMHPADTVLLQKGYSGKIQFVGDGDIFDLGGKKIKVCHTPAHTPGSIVLVDQDSRSCFTGDAFGSGLVWLHLRPLAPMQTYIQSCEALLKVMDNGVDSIWCGHYPYLKKALDRDYIVRMKDLAGLIAEGKAADTKPYDIVIPAGCPNPMVATDGVVSIVYDPANIKK